MPDHGLAVAKTMAHAERCVRVLAPLRLTAAVCLLCCRMASANWYFLGDTSAVVAYELLTPDVTYSHPSNPFESRDGTLMIVSVMGLSEGDNTCIGLYRDDGSGWGDPVIVAGPADLFDPTLAQTDDGTIYCFYYDGCCDDQKYRKSTDDGVTWGAEHDVHSDNDIGFAEQNNAKRHPNGDWFALESTDNPTSVGVDNAGDAIYVVAPSGQLENASSWGRSVIRSGWSTGDFLVVNPEETTNGHYRNLRAVLRCDFNCENQGSFAYSHDAGATWDHGYDIPFGDKPQCGELADVHALGQSTRTALSLDLAGGPLKGWHVIAASAKTAYCDAIDAAGVPQKWERGSIAVLRSNTGDHDDFHEVFLVRETGSGPENADPGMIRSSDGMLHLTFTGRDAAGIRHVTIDAAKLIGVTGSEARRTDKEKAGGALTGSWKAYAQGSTIRLPGMMEESGPVSIELMDARGRVLYRTQAFGTTASLPAMQLTGVFLVRLSVGTETRSVTAVAIR
ncbi:MAG: hypothetical protein GF331_11860 [Chitinivibrionales bacterium]|nr:hypothetical protein [Chitinivibrionales bacterium]